MTDQDKVIFIKSKKDLENERPPLTWQEKKVSISLGSIALFLAVILVIGGSFATGRYIFPSTGEGWSLSAAVAGEDNEIVTLGAEPQAAPEPVEEIVIEEPEVVEEAPPVEEPAPVVEETPAPEPEVEPEILTVYSDVSFKITDVNFEWLEEQKYGRITDIEYDLVNNDNGIVQALTARINVLGYDYTYEADILRSLQSVYPGKTSHGRLDRSVAYSSKVVDPDKVTISVDLIDKKGKKIAGDVVTRDLSK